jgi:hypothetical protein
MPTNSLAVSADEKSKTAFLLGKFLYSKPPKPDQIFKIQYRVVNGTAEIFSKGQGDMVAKVNVTQNGTGMLEVQFPRGYSYTNEFLKYGQGEGESGEAVFFVNGIETAGPEKRLATDCFFVFLIPFSGRAEIELVWTYLLVPEPYHGDAIPSICIPETKLTNPADISPLLQVRAGVAAKDVACKAGYNLVVNPSGKPFCALQSTSKTLKGRWNG